LNKLVFSIGDKVVYPGHGIAQVDDILTRNLGETEHKFFCLTILDGKGTKIMVPTFQVDSAGLRKIADKKEATKVYQILKERKLKTTNQTWNRRFRDYTEKLKTGSMYEIAEVIRDLSVLSSEKELSFGEKKMLESAQTLLVAEIAIIKSKPQEKILDEIQGFFV